MSTASSNPTPEDIIPIHDQIHVEMARADINIRRADLCRALNLILYHLVDIARQPEEEVI